LEEDLNLDPDVVFDKAAPIKQQWFNQLLDLVPTMMWLHFNGRSLVAITRFNDRYRLRKVTVTLNQVHEGDH